MRISDIDMKRELIPSSFEQIWFRADVPIRETRETIARLSDMPDDAEQIDMTVTEALLTVMCDKDGNPFDSTPEEVQDFLTSRELYTLAKDFREKVLGVGKPSEGETESNSE